jgi:predicted nuclease with TOPRIM domain
MEMNAWALKTIIMGVCIVLGFCLVAAGPTSTPTPEQQRARLVEIEKQSTDLSRKIQGCEYEKEKLRERHDAVTTEQVGYAADQKKLEEERAKILEGLKKQAPAKP